MLGYSLLTMIWMELGMGDLDEGVWYGWDRQLWIGNWGYFFEKRLGIGTEWGAGLETEGYNTLY